MEMTTISAKIPRSLKRKLEKYRLGISRIVRCALEEEVLKIEQSNLEAKLDDICVRLAGKVSPREVVAAVRSSREER